MPRNLKRGCVAFPSLRAEHYSKDVFQLPAALFGDDVCYITRCHEGSKPLHSLKIINRGGSGDKFSLSEAVLVAAECAKFDYVVLFHISYITFLIAGLVSLFSILRRGVPATVILQSDFAPKYAENYADRNQGAFSFAFRLGRQIPRFLFDVVCVASERGRTFLNRAVGVPNNNLFKVYNCPHFGQGSELDLPEDVLPRENVILFIGRKDDPQKNTVGIISAFEIVAKIRPDWKLKLIGPGRHYASDLNGISIFQEASISDRSQLRQQYLRSKIFLMPSLSNEGASLAFVEALINGCYPVATDAGNFVELIERVGEGGIVEVDPQSIASGLLAAIARLERDAGVHARISGASSFLNWNEQVLQIKEHLCLN